MKSPNILRVHHAPTFFWGGLKSQLNHFGPKGLPQTVAHLLMIVDNLVRKRPASSHYRAKKLPRSRVLFSRIICSKLRLKMTLNLELNN